MSSTLLIGVDPSAEDEDAVALGGVLARVFGARPVLVAAYSRSHGLLQAFHVEQLVRASAERRLQLARKRLGAFDAEIDAVAADSPAAALDRVAREIGARAIVVGSSAAAEPGRTLPGGVAESLLDGAPCGVALAPRGYAGRAERGLARIGIAFDGSPEAWRALDTAGAAAGVAGAELVLLTALDGDPAQTRGHAELAMMRMAGAPVGTRYLHGEPARAIADASADLDLLLIGSRGYGPALRTLQGSVSAEVARRARCPVLVLARGAEEPVSGRSRWMREIASPERTPLPR